MKPDQNKDHITGDKILGDKITLGDVQGTAVAIGNGARIVTNNIVQATAADEADSQETRERRILGNGLKRIAENLQQQARAADAHAGGSPYKALLEYTIDDAALFYGRDNAIINLLSRLSNPLTVLHSESGAGKTSLLKAGVLSRLLADGDLPIYLRFYKTRPDQALRRALIGDTQRAPGLANMSLYSFLQMAAGLLGEGNLVILLDQFEELFTLHEPKTRQAFAAELAACLDDPSLPVHWVFAIRGEWLSQIATLDPPIRRPYGNNMLLRALNEREAREVIVQPAATRGVTVDPALVDALLADLKLGEEIAPPQLQLVCEALYRAPDRDKDVLNLSLYQALGGSEGILKNHLQQVLEREVSPPYREAARRLLEALIDSQGRRAQREQDQLVGQLEKIGIAPTAAGEALRVLLDNRLLRVIEDQDDAGPEQVYELAHDYLLDRIDLDPEAQARKAAQELLERETRNYLEYDGTLLSSERLAIIEAQEAYLYIEPEAAALIESSRAERDRRIVEQERQRRSQTRILIGVTIMLLILATVALFFGIRAGDNAQVAEDNAATAVAESERAREEAIRSEALRLSYAAEQAYQVEKDPELAALLAIRSLTIDYSSEREETLNRALANIPFIQILEEDERVSEEWFAVKIAVFSPDGQTILTASFAGTASLWDATTGELVHAIDGDRGGWEIKHAVFSPDSKFVLTAGGVERARLWNVDTGELIEEFEGHSFYVNSAVFSPDGQFVLTAGNDTTVRLWDAVTGKQLRIFEGHTGPVRSAVFSPDGQTFLSASSEDDNVRLWDVDTGEQLRIFEGHTEAVTSAVFSPDGQTILTASWDTTTRLWDVDTGEQLRIFEDHQRAVTSAEFSPDGQTFLSTSRDATARLWDANTGQQLRIFRGDDDAVTSAAFSPDGQFVLTAWGDRTLRLWKVFIDDTLLYACTRVLRDLTDEERERYDISDDSPTCPQIAKQE